MLLCYDYSEAGVAIANMADLYFSIQTGDVLVRYSLSLF